MASKSVAGDWVTQAVFVVTETASNTLTFEKLETGLSIYDKVGWMLQRAEFTLGAGTRALFNSSGDTLAMALTMTNTLAAAQVRADNPAVYAMRVLERTDYGTAAVAILDDTSYVMDFSNLSGGGIMMLPNPLYFGIVGTGLAGPSTVIARMFYKAVELNDQDYFNLVQARQLLIST